MAYTNSDIENKALSLMSSELPAESAGILRAVCASAAAELESRLRKGVSSEEIQELFVTAAGMLALSMYIELSGLLPGDRVGSFSAGNVSVRLDGGAASASAANLRKYAENMLAAYLDGGFEFMGVRG